MGRPVRMFAMLGIAWLASSCATSSTLLVADARSGSHDPALGTEPQTIRAYVTRDGHRHPFNGWVQIVGDSVHLVQIGAAGNGLARARPSVEVWAPRDSIASVRAVMENTWPAIGFLFFATLLLAVLVIRYSWWAL